ncbi:hypothetical protein B0H19DRAFT_1273247 [Mycena capillaripes]|nr:hypothetical protein B0H19DRAFT_1273247 [Mycena capillaripes]
MTSISISSTLYPSPVPSYEPDPTPVAYTYTECNNMMIPLVGFVLFTGITTEFSGYIVGKYYIQKWRAANAVANDEKWLQPAWRSDLQSSLSLRDLQRSDLVFHHQQRPFYISQADMLTGNGRDFLG